MAAFEDEIKTVQEKPLVLILRLADGQSPGRWGAAENFAEIITEVHVRYPDKKFQFLPFNYSLGRVGPALESILAVAD